MGFLVFYLSCLKSVCLYWSQPTCRNMGHPWCPRLDCIGCVLLLFWGSWFYAQAFVFLWGLQWMFFPHNTPSQALIHLDSPLWTHSFYVVLVDFCVAVIKHWPRTTWRGKGLCHLTYKSLSTMKGSQGSNMEEELKWSPWRGTAYWVGRGRDERIPGAWWHLHFRWKM